MLITLQHGENLLTTIHSSLGLRRELWAGTPAFIEPARVDPRNGTLGAQQTAGESQPQILPISSHKTASHPPTFSMKQGGPAYLVEDNRHSLLCGNPIRKTNLNQIPARRCRPINRPVFSALSVSLGPLEPRRAAVSSVDCPMLRVSPKSMPGACRSQPSASGAQRVSRTATSDRFHSQQSFLSEPRKCSPKFLSRYPLPGTPTTAEGPRRVNVPCSPSHPRR
ncbi:hypothetical protein B0I37DRAFT_97320 [Chaetomium sp. MPI-CAGE-AT-0009]|nr:hypothetical protein B0I37DRAFT_97320 [Chaetomium sp. MPI-CAGE-AT-0009]